MDVRFRDFDCADWNSLIGPYQALPQSWAYGAAMAALGAQVLRGDLGGGGTVQLMWQPRWYGRRAVANRCEVASGEALRALRRAVPGGGVSALWVSTESGETPQGAVPLLTPVHLAELDLRPDLGQLRRNMHGKWRNRLRAAERGGMELHVRTDVPGWLLQRETAQQRQRGYQALPPKFVRAWAAHGPLLTLTAMQGDAPLAAMLFLRHGHVASYHIGWCSDAGRRRGAHPWLLWQAMQRLRAQGIARLDLGPIATDTAPGLARFKLGSGAQLRVLGPTSVIGPGSGFIPAMAAKARSAAPRPARQS